MKRNSSKNQSKSKQMKKSQNLLDHTNGKVIPIILSHEQACIVYKLLFPDDNGRLPSRPDILYSLQGKWKGWKESLSNGSIEDEINKSKEDARFINAWEQVFRNAK
jgi:hypothetical protein